MSSSEDENWGVKRALSTPRWTSDEIKNLKELFKHEFYSTEYLQHLVECEKALNQEPFEVTIRTFDAKGQSHNIKAKGPDKRIIMCSYHQLACQREDQPEADEGFAGMLVRAGKAWPVRKDEKCCAKAGRLETIQEMVRNWKKMPFYAKMRVYVEKYAKRMVEVKSVACFGLGRLKIDPDMIGMHAGQNYLQHYAAVRLRDLIAEVQKKPKHTIPIYAQDPAYCANCRAILEEELGITVVPGNSGFLKVDGHTFVVTKAPTAPVCQIVGDITKKVKGPAGMLCDIIHGDGEEAADGIVDMCNPSLYLDFYLGACKNKMLMEMVRDPEDSDEDDDDSDARVEHGDWTVEMGSVFGEIGWYFKDKMFA